MTGLAPEPAFDLVASKSSCGDRAGIRTSALYGSEQMCRPDSQQMESKSPGGDGADSRASAWNGSGQMSGARSADGEQIIGR